VYRLLLRAYPATFRSEYGREMTMLFRDAYRTRDATTLAFWASMVWDVARSATSIWVDALCACGREYTRTFEVIMKTAGMMAILIGVYGALGGLAEAVAGMRGTLETTHVLSVVFGIVAAALLLGAGAALLRRPVDGERGATIASIASFAIILIARLTHPWMSIFAQLVGFGFPIALLVAMHWPQRRGPSSSEAL
jgi:hypothetical protein